MGLAGWASDRIHKGELMATVKIDGHQPGKAIASVDIQIVYDDGSELDYVLVRPVEASVHYEPVVNMRPGQVLLSSEVVGHTFEFCFINADSFSGFFVDEAKHEGE